MDKNNLSNLFQFVKQSYENFVSTEQTKFSEVIDREKWDLKEPLKSEFKKKSGIYVIYKLNSPEKAIYVGSTSDLFNRIGWLFFISKKGDLYHSLTYNLIKKAQLFKDINEAREFYFSSCAFRYVITENRAIAVMLEGIFIELLRPTYNKEIIKSYQQ